MSDLDVDARTIDERLLSERLERMERRAQQFFYVLLRDHLPSGVVERIFAEHVDPAQRIVLYSNEHLAAYAAELARRLQGDPL